MLKKIKFKFAMVIVGTLSKDEHEYYSHMQELVSKYDLAELVKLEVNVELSDLLHIL
jgi:hypothetical protein